MEWQCRQNSIWSGVYSYMFVCMTRDFRKTVQVFTVPESDSDSDFEVPKSTSGSQVPAGSATISSSSQLQMTPSSQLQTTPSSQLKTRPSSQLRTTLLQLHRGTQGHSFSGSHSRSTLNTNTACLFHTRFTGSVLLNFTCIQLNPISIFIADTWYYTI